MRCFRLPYLLHNAEQYLIWIIPGDSIFSNSKDLVAVDQQGLIPTFANPEVLSRYAESYNYLIEAEPHPTIDLDWLANWCSNCSSDDPTVIKISEVFHAWRLFECVAASVPNQEANFEQLLQSSSEAYDKLYFAFAAPLVLKAGERFDPKWTKQEITRLRLVMTSGLRLFLANIRR